jgi:hypothetical protein
MTPVNQRVQFKIGIPAPVLPRAEALGAAIGFASSAIQSIVPLALKWIPSVASTKGTHPISDP